MTLPVAVAADDPTAREAASREALRLDRPLLPGLHAWQDTTLEPDRYSTPGEVDWGLLLPDEQRTLAEVLAGCAEDWPDVPLRRAVVRAPLGPTLLATALSAQLLVLGVHRRCTRAGVRLVLHRPPCPVELVPVPTAIPPVDGPTRVRSHRLHLVLEDHR